MRYLVGRSDKIARSYNPNTTYWELIYPNADVLIDVEKIETLHPLKSIKGWYNTNEYYNYTTNTCAEPGYCSPYLKVIQFLVSNYRSSEKSIHAFMHT